MHASERNHIINAEAREHSPVYAGSTVIEVGSRVHLKRVACLLPSDEGNEGIEDSRFNLGMPFGLKAEPYPVRHFRF